MKIYIKAEQLPYFLELIGCDKINKLEFYGVTEDNKLEKVSLHDIKNFLNAENNVD